MPGARTRHRKTEEGAAPRKGQAPSLSSSNQETLNTMSNNAIPSENHHVLTGHLKEDATWSESGNALFTIIHDQKAGEPALLKNIIMYSSDGPIPGQLLRKGTPVRVEYYEKAVRGLSHDNEKKTYTVCVARSVTKIYIPERESTMDLNR